MYVIIQQSRLNPNDYLGLIDRTKNNTQWWTTVIENLKQFTNKEEANNVALNYKYNNVRVVPLEEAKNILHPIITIKYTLKETSKRKNIFEMNPYEYKEWLGQGNDDWHEHNGGSGGY